MLGSSNHADQLGRDTFYPSIALTRLLTVGCFPGGSSHRLCPCPACKWALESKCEAFHIIRLNRLKVHDLKWCRVCLLRPRSITWPLGRGGSQSTKGRPDDLAWSASLVMAGWPSLSSILAMILHICHCKHNASKTCGNHE